VTDWRLIVTAVGSVGAHLAGAAGGYALLRTASDDGVLVVVLNETTVPERSPASGPKPEPAGPSGARSTESRQSTAPARRAPAASADRAPAPSWDRLSPLVIPPPILEHDVPILPPSPAPAPPAAALLQPSLRADMRVASDPRETLPDASAAPAGVDRGARSESGPGSGSAGAGGPDTRDGTAAGGSGDAAALAWARGEGGAGAGQYTEYLASIRARLQQALRYPLSARRRGASGVVQLEILIHADGRIGDVVVAGSSTHQALDDAAVEAVRSLPPQPFPAGVKPRVLRARLPVVFELR
jgi:periplasmic protein TonB